MEKKEIKNTQKKKSNNGKSKGNTSVSTKSASKKTSVASTKKTATQKVKASSNTKKVNSKVKKETVNNEKIKQDVISTDNKKNNEIIKMIIVIVILIALIVATFIIGITHNGNKFLYQKHVGIQETSVSQYMDIIDDNDISIVYIARPTCSYCQMFEPVLTSVLEKYKIGVEYVNIDNITTEDEWNTFYNSNEYLKAGEWGTPTLIVFKNKEILNVNAGYVDEATLVKFLKDNDLIKGE